MSDPKKQIIIIGAGVTGLQTAISLSTSPETSHFKISIIAAHLPSKEPPEYKNPIYSSASCGGYWHSNASSIAADAEVRAWDRRTYEYWSQLLDCENEEGEEKESYEERVKRIGLGWKEALHYWLRECPEAEGRDGSGIWYRDVVKDFEVLDLQKEGDESIRAPPEGVAVFGVRYQTVCINTPRYLEFLMETVRGLGVSVIEAKVHVGEGVEGVVRDAKAKLLEQENGGREEDIFAVINCTGDGAKKFVEKEERDKLRYVLGQQLLLKGEVEKAGSCEGFPEEWGMEYIIPRPGTGTSVLGGSRFDLDVHDWDQNVSGNWNATMTQRLRIWGFAKEISDEGDEGRADGFKCLHFDIGIYPKRIGGPRVEVQGKERIEGVWVVHSYGHNESGFTNSVGCAEKVAGLICKL